MTPFEVVSTAAVVLGGLWAVGALILSQWAKLREQQQDTERQNIELRARRAEEQLSDFRVTVDKLDARLEKHGALIHELDKAMTEVRIQIRNLAEAFKSFLRSGHGQRLQAQDLNGGEATRLAPPKKKG